MAAPKKTTKKAPARARSLYAQTGDDARREAQRKLLLKTLKEQDWNLTATAEALGMAGSSAVIKALRDVAPDEYEKARDDRRVSQGNRRCADLE